MSCCARDGCRVASHLAPSSGCFLYLWLEESRYRIERCQVARHLAPLLPFPVRLCPKRGPRGEPFGTFGRFVFSSSVVERKPVPNSREVPSGTSFGSLCFHSISKPVGASAPPFVCVFSFLVSTIKTYTEPKPVAWTPQNPVPVTRKGHLGCCKGRGTTIADLPKRPWL